MVLLKSGTLTPRMAFTPESMRLDIQERDGSATMSIKIGTPALAIGDWLQDDTEPGKGIIWRVSGVETDYSTDTQRITLEHIIHVLDDYIMDGEYEWDSISCANAATAVLEWNPWWRLGSCDYSVSLPYSFNGDSCMEALETISDTLEDCEWQFDLSRLPFRISLKKPDTSVQSEMRCGRNLKTLKRSVSRKGMYTRFFPIGEDDLRVPGRYLSRNEDKYGVICKTETESGYDSVAMLHAWAEGRLRQHCEPSATITATGLNLAQATGEPLDKMVVCRRCRIPLPEYNTTITEKITQLSWNDKIGDPEGVTVTLSKNPQDVSSIFKSESSSTAKSSRSGAKKAKEDHAWFTDTEDHVSMTAEAILGKSEDGQVNWSRMADITVNGDGIFQSVTETKGDLVVAKSNINVQKNWIDATTKAIGKDGKVTAASLCLAINKDGSSEARLDADKVYIGNEKSTTVIRGKLNTKDLYAELAKLDYISTKGVVITDGGVLRFSDTRDYISGSMAGGLITDLRITRSGNNYQMQKKTVHTPGSWANVEDGNFSRAVSSVEWSWTGGAAKAVLKPQNQTFYSPALDMIYAGAKTWDADNKGFNVPIYVDDAKGTTVFNDVVHFDASTAYNAGYKVTSGQVSGSVGGTTPTSAGTSPISGRRSLGSVARPSAASYVLINLSVHGYSIPCYITLT